MSCDDIRARLEEYFDRELSDADAARVKSHVADCADCARELSELDRLEGLLRRAAVDSAPRDGFVDRVRDRARRRPGGWHAWLPLSLAAAVTFAIIASHLFAPGAPYDLESALRDISSPDAAARTRAEAWTRAHGDEVALALVKALSDVHVERQKSAGLLIARLSGDLQSRILAQQPAVQEEWELAPIGSDISDIELVGYAVGLARSEKTADEALRILKKLDRGGTNREAHEEIVRQVGELFASGQEAQITTGFRIVEGLRLLVEDVVEFLDVPELGDRALEFLRGQTGRDFGKDKDAWRRYFRSREM
jgi:anti-sigma factor RsiW